MFLEKHILLSKMNPIFLAERVVVVGYVDKRMSYGLDILKSC